MFISPFLYDLIVHDLKKSVHLSVTYPEKEFRSRSPISVLKGMKILEELYELTDRNMKQFEKYAPCAKGCSECCHVLAEISPIGVSIKAWTREVGYNSYI